MKRRKWSVFAALLLLITVLVLSVRASEHAFVDDSADILTTEEELLLEETAQKISQQYGCGVYIVTLWDYSAYGSNVRSAAEKYYTNHNCGLGDDADGILLMLSMAERDYALIAHGELSNRAFTDYGKELLSEEFLDDFRYDAWFDGFEDYLSVSDEFLSAAVAGKPVDVAAESGSSAGLTLIMLLLIPAVIAGVACGIMAATMKTARKQTHADAYQKGIQLTHRHDRFITRTVVRQKIESSSSSSGGGTRINSGGFSGKSGKF